MNFDTLSVVISYSFISYFRIPVIIQAIIIQAIEFITKHHSRIIIFFKIMKETVPLPILCTKSDNFKLMCYFLCLLIVFPCECWGNYGGILFFESIRLLKQSRVKFFFLNAFSSVKQGHVTQC